MDGLAEAAETTPALAFRLAHCPGVPYRQPMVEEELDEILRRFDEAKQLRCGNRVLECWRDVDNKEVRLREGAGGVVVAVDETQLGRAARAPGDAVTSALVASLLCFIFDHPQGHSGVRLIRNP